MFIIEVTICWCIVHTCQFMYISCTLGTIAVVISSHDFSRLFCISKSCGISFLFCLIVWQQLIFLFVRFMSRDENKLSM